MTSGRIGARGPRHQARKCNRQRVAVEQRDAEQRHAEDHELQGNIGKGHWSRRSLSILCRIEIQAGYATDDAELIAVCNPNSIMQADASTCQKPSDYRRMKTRPSPIACRARILLMAGFASTIATTAPVGQAAESGTRAKNIILMIADGTGANTMAATGMYTGKLGRQVFDGRCVDQVLCLDLSVANGADSDRGTRRLGPGPRDRLRPREKLGHRARHDNDRRAIWTALPAIGGTSALRPIQPTPSSASSRDGKPTTPRSMSTATAGT